MINQYVPLNAASTGNQQSTRLDIILSPFEYVTDVLSDDKSENCLRLFKRYSLFSLLGTTD